MHLLIIAVSLLHVSKGPNYVGNCITDNRGQSVFKDILSETTKKMSDDQNNNVIC